MNHSDTLTAGIRVQIQSEYLAERSNPAKHLYFFIYHVVISNEGDAPATLRARHWIITNGEGQLQQVRGAGVVGATPRLSPGERFSYTSACPLDTPVGSMRGSYQMTRDSGEGFDAMIDTFTLSVPYAIN